MIDVARREECEPTRAAAWRALWRRIVTASLAALREVPRRRADRDIARMIARSGGCLSDAVERAIMHRHLPLSDWAAEPTAAETGIEPPSKEKGACRKRSWSSIAMPWF